MKTTTPEASIIIPVYQRSSTLSAALTSVQLQSIENIQIVVVLDGANDKCKEIVYSFSASDKRFLVHDLPKGKGAGKDNMHKGVLSASAEKIFYTDDDDILLPKHIETLSDVLDKADFVDSRVCSVDRESCLHLSPVCGSNVNIRSLLGNGTLKLLYDTHVAHTASAYQRFSKWSHNPKLSYGPVWDFFVGFAHSEDCNWVSLDEVTALSLHGACRRDMSDLERATEIEQWLHISQSNKDLVGSLDNASITYNLFRLMSVAPPDHGCLSEYLAYHGAYQGQVFTEIDHDLFDLFKGDCSVDKLVEVVIVLSSLVIAGYLFEQLSLTVVNKHGVSVALEVTEKLRLRRLAPLKKAGVWSFIACIYRYAQKEQEAIEAIDAAISFGPDPIGALENYKQRTMV